MHGTSRVGIAYATHARPAEFYKFRHPNRSYQRFYGWCLSRQQGRGQFPHTCQAETLQEFFSCREAQSAVHNDSTKTTTEKLMNDHLLPASDSGPTPRRAKSDFLSVRRCRGSVRAYVQFAKLCLCLFPSRGRGLTANANDSCPCRIS
jgi:hypothetical protein